MIRLRALSIALCLGLAAPAAWAADPVLVIHGGAGLERKDVTPQDEAAIRAALDDCLLSADGFRPGSWANMPDPFPAWGEAQRVPEPAA